MGGMTNNFDPNQKRGGPANAGNWTKYENSDPEAALERAGDQASAARLRAKYRHDVEGKPAMELIRWMDNPQTEIGRAQAELLAEHADLYVVRVLARSEHRYLLGEDYQQMLMSHPDETVRTNYYDHNSHVPENTLREAAASDPSAFVQQATQAEIDARRTGPAVAAVKSLHPWATPAQAARIAAGTPNSTSATWDGNLPEEDEEPMRCAHCGEELVSNLDAVRGRWGHAETEDTTCHSAETIAATGFSLRESAAGYLVTNPVESARLTGLAESFAATADQYAAQL